MELNSGRDGELAACPRAYSRCHLTGPLVAQAACLLPPRHSVAQRSSEPYTYSADCVCFLAQALTALSVVLAVAWATHRYAPAAAKKVYLLDTFTYKPPDRCGCVFVHTCKRI